MAQIFGTWNKHRLEAPTSPCGHVFSRRQVKAEIRAEWLWATPGKLVSGNEKSGQLVFLLRAEHMGWGRSRDSSCGSNLHILMFFFHLVVIQLLQRVEGEKLRMKRQQWPKWLMDMGQLAKQSVDSSLHLGVHQTGSWRIGACSAMRSFCTRRVYFRNIH